MTVHHRLYISRTVSDLFSNIFLMFLIGFAAAEHRADIFIMLLKMSFLRCNCSFSDCGHVDVFVFPTCIVIVEIECIDYYFITQTLIK